LAGTSASAARYALSQQSKRTFTDRTERAGLAVETIRMGVAIAPLQQRRFPDVLITAVARIDCFRYGRGNFIDVTAKAGWWSKLLQHVCDVVDFDLMASSICCVQLREVAA